MQALVPPHRAAVRAGHGADLALWYRFRPCRCQLIRPTVSFRQAKQLVFSWERQLLLLLPWDGMRSHRPICCIVAPCEPIGKQVAVEHDVGVICAIINHRQRKG